MQFSCALVTDVVRCFGNNVHGILGKPFADVALTPVPQAIAFGGHEHDIVAITAGQDHACALARDNAVWCWGSHAEAQLGSTASTAPGLEPSKSLFTPVNVPGVSDGERVTAVTAGKNHTCVLRESGAVGCWGANGRGQLGSVTALPRSERVVFVRGLEGRVTELSAGDDRTCARTAEGDIYCWGASDSGAADLTAPKLIARLL